MARLAIIKKEKCRPNLCSWECVRHCPVNMTGSDCIYEGEDKKAKIDEILCTGCGICPKICPFDAITIINLPELKDKGVIHQYGINGFRIFDLPLIQENSITGIIGRNGIGKSTVINVLSNSLRANFGIFGVKGDEDKYFTLLNEKFKGTALQNYFSKLSKKEIRVSYKPQQIINIPEMFKGRVIDLFKRVIDDEDKISKLCNELNISNVLGRDISVLSGGELQRLAIATSLLKEDCNLFVFDEITNYLDIFERLNSSKLIKNRVQGKTALLVEHDLVVLDYLLDFVHIMYGEQGAYGMLTGIKSGKAGINDYLLGYSKEENVRFRDKAISFDKESVTETKKVHILAKWDKENIVRGDFKLNIEKGDIKRGEIMGIIGRNALGKSTFVKHIASKGFENTVISYKEQLIKRSENLVKHELAVFPNYEDNFYKIYVLEPLRIEKIQDKKINELSGGELQRYAVARCLLENADIYLIDEPTAFLDIEDRLKLAKILKNFIQLKEKSAFIVDHDLVFMDYLSDRLLVFEGRASIEGNSSEPLEMREGMNKFLAGLNITFRRDDANKRPRVNKDGSVKDQEQKKIGEYYYA
jgi:ATP-binding cassette subfamily E protein 1